jgi:hypothetical protein
MSILPPSISRGLKLRISPILIPPRAISSRMSRFLLFEVLKMISSTVSFSTIFQGTGFWSLNVFRRRGDSQGFTNFSLPELMMKLKKARSRENRSLLVDWRAPSVRRLKKERISSEVRESPSRSPNWAVNSARRYS